MGDGSWTDERASERTNDERTGAFSAEIRDREHGRDYVTCTRSRRCASRARKTTDVFSERFSGFARWKRIATDESDGVPVARSSAGRRVRGATRTNVRDRRGDGSERKRDTRYVSREREREKGWEWDKRDLPRAPCPSSCLLGRENQQARWQMYPRDTSHVTRRALLTRAPGRTVILHTHRTAPRNARDRALEITRHAHNHTNLQHVALVTTDCLLA